MVTLPYITFRRFSVRIRRTAGNLQFRSEHFIILRFLVRHSIFNVFSQLETHLIIPHVSSVSKEQPLKGEGCYEGEKEVSSIDYIPLLNPLPLGEGKMYLVQRHS